MSRTAPSKGAGRRGADRALRLALPLLVLGAVVFAWHLVVVMNDIPHYVLPRPGLVARTLVDDWALLGPSLWGTVRVTLLALALAVLGAGLLAVALSSSRIAEYSIFPIAVVLQVTPIVAVFPLINIYVESTLAKILLCAWIISFFPILSNTVVGLNSADRNLSDLFRLNGASGWQSLWLLRLPSALPTFLAGLRISGGLALVGAVVAEFVTGAQGFGSGLATRLIEAGYQLKIPRLFAALLLISGTGIAIYAALALLTHVLIGRWHESARRER